MSLTTIRRKLNRTVSVYQELGLVAIVSRLLRRVRLFVCQDDPKHTQWLQQKLATDAAFDATNGTQTGGVQEIFDFKIVGENAGHGLSHIASDPNQFAEMMAKLDIDFSAFTFIDLGSGKGRALMLAAAFPFRRIIGVEFAAELHAAAKENFAALGAARGVDPRIELVYGDAATYVFPVEPLVIYLHNPFDSKIVRRVAESVLASWRDAPRPIRILYVYPVYLSDFIDVGWVPSDGSQGYANLVPPSESD